MIRWITSGKNILKDNCYRHKGIQINTLYKQILHSPLCEISWEWILSLTWVYTELCKSNCREYNDLKAYQSLQNPAFKEWKLLCVEDFHYACNDSWWQVFFTQIKNICKRAFLYLLNKYLLTWTQVHCDLLLSDLLNKTSETCFVLKAERIIQPKGAAWWRN